MPAPNYAQVRGHLAAAAASTASLDALTALTALFAALGQQALEDRRGRDGMRWGLWADWCWRNDLPLLPAGRDAAIRFVQDLAAEVDDADEIITICAVVATRHLEAGYDDPWAAR